MRSQRCRPASRRRRRSGAPPPTAPGATRGPQEGAAGSAPRCRPAPRRRSSVRPPPRKHHWDRLAEDLEVPPERPVRDVDVVELHHLVEGQVVPAQDLPQAGNARREIESAAGPTLDLARLVNYERPRPD